MIFAFLQRTTTSFAQTMRLIDVQIKVIPQKYKPKSVFHNENCKEMKTRKTVAPQWMNLIAIKRTCIRYTAAHLYMNISVLLFFFISCAGHRLPHFDPHNVVHLVGRKNFFTGIANKPLYRKHTIDTLEIWSTRRDDVWFD